MKTKLILLSILAFPAFISITAQTCLPDGVRFSTQEQIDRFQATYPKCNAIRGSVIIDDRDDNNITNLKGLSMLRQIKGSLSITNNASLQNMTGLENLQKIGGHLNIMGNDSLVNMKGLENLVSISEVLNVNGNPSLKTLQGMDKLSTVDGYKIEDNPLLTDLNGVDTITNEHIAKPIKVEYQTWISTMDKTLTIYGYLNAVSDSTFVLTNFNDLSNPQPTIIDVSNMEIIKFRKSGKVGRGIFFGAILGGALGAIIGRASYTPCTGGLACIGSLGPASDTAAGAGLGLIAGGIIGGIVGSAKIKIPINGDQKAFDQNRAEILKYSFRE